LRSISLYKTGFFPLQVELRADNLHFFLIRLAKEGTSSLVRRSGNLDFSCARAPAAAQADLQQDVRLVR
jgi:hypothetical protein